ncbi:hypothetical protein Trydic_g13660 [Trypoxylus dichotomus]
MYVTVMSDTSDIRKLLYATPVEITCGVQQGSVPASKLSLVHDHNFNLPSYSCSESQFAKDASYIIPVPYIDHIAGTVDKTNERPVDAHWSFTKWQED